MINLESICKQAASLAIETGKYIREENRKFRTEDIIAKGLNDFVSYVDKSSERQLVNGLKKLLPEAGFITEENTVERTENRYTWIIDPLDGTTNFIHSLPCFAISIALAENGKPELGVIYEINLNECFTAWKRGGAFLNGNKIAVSKAPFLKDSLIATGFPYYDYSRMKEYMELLTDFMKKSHGVRRIGSAATDLAYVACGRFEGFYEYGLSPWDVAAGIIIIQEAGGVVSDFKGGENYLFGKEIIASNSKIFNEFAGVIRRKMS